MTTPTPPIPKKKYLKREKTTDTKRFYVTNAQLLEEFHACKANGGKLSDKMAKYLLMVAEKYSRHPWFVGYSFREDMIAAAMVNLCANWHKFNPEKQENPNPFSYYTTAVYRSFLGFLAAEKEQRNIRDELLIEAGASPSFNYRGTSSDDTAFMGRSEE